MKKRVLYVHHAGSLGGAPKSLTYLISHLDRELYEAEVISINDGPAVELLRTVGLPVKVVRRMYAFHGTTVSGMSARLFVRNILGSLPTYIMAKRYIKAFKPDIIHLNSTCLFMVAKAAKDISKEIRVVCHVREPLLASFPGKILRIMNHRYVDGFISIDHYDAATINSKERELEVINNFVDFHKYNPAVSGTHVREELGLKDEDVAFLYLGRVVEGNGVSPMLQAFLNVVRDNPRFHLIVAGFYFDNTNPYEDRIVTEAEGERNVHLLKFREDVPSLLAASDVMVCPFIEPHFSRSIIEAAAMRKTSIASNIGGPNELVLHGQTGFLFGEGDWAELEAYMIRLGNDDELRASLGEKALAFAREHFDATKNAKRTFEFYNRLYVREAYGYSVH
ncbi:glycosyltransferase family 4 protein [Paenibacillus oenotherae]|uniref:Glycosyltransferase family 4 protein n=1 Tax=Paenibacillus oenotherae TaxID=1435645 RepID=A0ABS7D9V6_9BACL|nr:glycosyltransferase family 4 protein [Paenibacillus oenotherae]MBW7476720.1 glycosyltransferase family 4 protein [Paenibacillus oenotherae]